MARDTNGDGEYDGREDDDSTANDGNDAYGDPDDDGGMLKVVVMGTVMVMGMLLLLLRMAHITHWLLSMWRKYTNALFLSL